MRAFSTQARLDQLTLVFQLDRSYSLVIERMELLFLLFKCHVHAVSPGGLENYRRRQPIGAYLKAAEEIFWHRLASLQQNNVCLLRPVGRRRRGPSRCPREPIPIPNRITPRNGRREPRVSHKPLGMYYLPQIHMVHEGLAGRLTSGDYSICGHTRVYLVKLPKT